MLQKVNDILAGIPATLVGGVFLILSLLLPKLGVSLPVDPAWVTVFISGLPLLYLALWRVKHNPGISKISSALLISIAMIAAIAIGDLFAAGEVAFIMALEEYCRYSGDLDFGRDLLPVCERILDALAANVRGNLAWRLEDPKYWNFYEWQPMLDGYGDVVLPSAEAGLQLFGLLALQRMRALKVMLGAADREGDLAVEAALETGLEQFWNEDEQAYASFIRSGRQVHYAELIQSLALCAGVCSAERQAILRERLLHGGLVPVTLSYSLFKYEALLQDPACTEAVFDEIADRWGAMLFQGATTFWEVDEGAPAFDRAGSLCHGWSAIPLYLYGAYGLGVRPEKPGEWRVQQTPCKLKIDATLRSPEGYFCVATHP